MASTRENCGSPQSFRGSPVFYNAEESICSLEFAARARSVELGKATKHVEQTVQQTTMTGGMGGMAGIQGMGVGTLGGSEHDPNLS